jgi:iron complex outermembrane recepter protein
VIDYSSRIIIPAIFSVLLVFLCVNRSFAQVNIRGEVLEDLTGEPLIGASIMIVGTNSGTVTEWDGSFLVRVDALPVSLEVSYTGFDSKSLVVEDAHEKFIIKLSEDAVLLNAVEITGSRVSDHRKESPLTVESLDIIAIQQTAANDFYEGLGALKGVDLTTASLGFTIINTRGFNSTSPVRSLQIIDGVDNQSPGLNFSLGNFLGAPELDVLKVELIQGASSAYFGPNAFNGVIDIRTKDPFIHQGFSISLKGAERNLFQGMFRYAKAFGDKFAFKINGSYLRADDWKARNFGPTFQSEADETNPGGYDAVNEYGDENLGSSRDATGLLSRVTFPGLGMYYRKGYIEEDLVDYSTENYKGNAGLFYKITPDIQAEATFNFGSGTTVYQGENRFRLDGIFFWQAKLELKQKDKFFIRAYTTQEDAGDSYDAYATALRLLKNAKSDSKWTTDYVRYWQTFNANKVRGLEGYPTGQDPLFFQKQDSIFLANSDSLFAWHADAQEFANKKSIDERNKDYFVPGTPEFEEQFNSIISSLSTDPDNPGTKLYDKSKLYHVHGEYKFESGFADYTVGGNFRQYLPETKGTIFLDTGSVIIRNNEFGFYGGLTKKLIPAKLKLNVTVRLDKNQNFNAVVSPAASLIYTPDINNTFRLSFSSAVRNPTLSDQYLNFDVGRAKLRGNITGFDSLVTPESFINALTYGNDTLEYFNEPQIRPEQVKSIEIGWRGTLFDKLWIDMSYYYSSYQYFIGYKFAIDILAFEPQTQFPLFFDILRISANAQTRVTTQGFSIGGDYYLGQYVTLSGNYSWNVLNKKGTDDPIVPAFNTPEHKFNIGLSGHGMPFPIIGGAKHGFGFNINYKWIQGFLFEGSPQFTGLVPTYDLLDVQVNWRVEKIKTTIKIGASNVLNNKQFQTYGGPRIGRLAYISFLYQ